MSIRHQMGWSKATLHKLQDSIRQMEKLVGEGEDWLEPMLADYVATRDAVPEYRQRQVVALFYGIAQAVGESYQCCDKFRSWLSFYPAEGIYELNHCEGPDGDVYFCPNCGTKVPR